MWRIQDGNSITCCDYRSSMVSTSIVISLSCRYEHYSVLSAIIRKEVPFSGCGKELLFLGTSRDPFSFFPVPSAYAAKWTSILPSQRNPNFDLTVPNKDKQKRLKCGGDALLKLWAGIGSHSLSDMYQAILPWVVLTLFPLCSSWSLCAVSWLHAHKEVF